MNYKNKPLHLINPSSKKPKQNEPKLFGFTAPQVRDAVRNVTFGLASLITPGGAAKGVTRGAKAMKEYRVGGKLYGHFTKGGKLTNKHIK
tara:strand:- start:45 stop:314 length:270 start_codon:yes stop_codon:yes gene_type:complete